MNYSPLLPRDKSDAVKTAYPPAASALGIVVRENASTSSILLLGHDTTELEVGAMGTAVALKWMPQALVDSSVAGTSVITAAGTANYDNIIAADTVRRFVVPRVGAGYTQSVQGVNRAEGLFPAVAFKSVGIGSVVTIQN